ncbi:MAG TPA: RDD family protein, partial [Actinomycetota bacterium]|nr:RDD family protein [Actinomycetota bacterium]
MGQQTGQYANWFMRVIAYIIDILPVAILNGIGFLLAGPSTQTTTLESGASITTTTGLGALYWLFWAIGIVYFVWNKAYLE